MLRQPALSASQNGEDTTVSGDEVTNSTADNVLTDADANPMQTKAELFGIDVIAVEGLRLVVVDNIDANCGN